MITNRAAAKIIESRTVRIAAAWRGALVWLIGAASPRAVVRDDR
jgi:hypothetical protein